MDTLNFNACIYVTILSYIASKKEKSVFGDPDEYKEGKSMLTMTSDRVKAVLDFGHLIPSSFQI